MAIYEIIVNEHYNGFNPTQYGYEQCAPNHGYGPAIRPCWILHFVISGKGYFRREGREYTINPGEIFVIPPYLETYYEADKKTPWYYTWIGFECDGGISDVFDQPVIRCPGVSKVFDDMRRCQNMQSGKSAFLSAKIWELVSNVLESGKKEKDYIEQAISCINSEYMTDISVNALARRLNIDRCYLSSMFSKKVGMSPSQYMLNLRLEKAAELMVKYGESPSVASASVGYADIYNFSKMFKKKYGLSPRNYIKKYTAPNK